MDRLERQIGPFNKGIMGDQYHFGGYHIGGAEAGPYDYSAQLDRDVAGIEKYGGDWAAAVDIGMGWPASREWVLWLVKECQRGKFPDIREIIGSFDGKQCFQWDEPTRDLFRHPWDDHLDHTHISFYRDAIMRSQVAVIGSWTARGRPPSSPVTKQGVRPSPSPSGALDAVGDVLAAPSFHLTVGSSVLLAAGAAAAWIIRRRNQLGG